MGMYTELIIGCMLKETTPPEVIDTLKYLFRDNADEPIPANCPNPTSRVPWMFRSGGSDYFGSPSPVPALLIEDPQGGWRLHGRFNIKNYENEIDSFLEWIHLYVEQGSGSRDMWAIVIYEEQDEPTIHYLKDKDE